MDHSSVARLGHSRVIRDVPHPVRDVLLPPVREIRRHHQLLPASRLEHHFLRRHFHPLHHHTLLLRFLPVRRSRPYPVHDRLVVLRSHLEPQPAPMRHTERRLQQQQALLRLLQINPRMLRCLVRRQHPERSSLHRPLVIVVRIDPVHRKLEPSAPLHPAMTQRVVAAPLGEDPINLPRKRERTRLLRLLHMDRRLRRPPSVFRRQHHFTRTPRHKLPRGVDLTFRGLRQ